MIYFSYGIRKSGSTLAYELTKGLLEALGHPQNKLDLPCFGDSMVNFLNSQETFGFSKTVYDTINQAIGNDSILAIKTHGPPSDFLMKLGESGEILAHTIIRDPRDNVLSALDAGGKAQARGRGGFINITDIKIAVGNYKKQKLSFEKWKSLPVAIICDYDEVAFQSELFLQRVGEQLGYRLAELPDLEKIVKDVKKKAFTQYNIGIKKRHRHQLSLSQTIQLTNIFRDELQSLFSDQLDELDHAILSIGLNEQKSKKEEPDGLEDFVPLLKSSELKGKTNLNVEEKPLSFYNRIKRKFPNTFNTVILAIEHLKINSGISHINSTTKKTFVVLGCPRGGTSLIAGALQKAGIFMGNTQLKTHEDPDFKVKPKMKNTALDKLRPIINNRNRNHEYWGWKVPNNIYYIDEVKHLLINPVYLFVYRDLEAIARSSAKHDKRNWEKASVRLLEVANNHTNKVKEFQNKLKSNYHVFQLEDIHKNPEEFVDTLLEIVKPLNPESENILRFINPKGGYS